MIGDSDVMTAIHAEAIGAVGKKYNIEFWQRVVLKDCYYYFARWC